MKTMSRLNVMKHQDTLAKMARAKPEMAEEIRKELSRCARQVIGHGLSNPIVVTSHQIEMIAEGLRLGSPSIYTEHIDRILIKFRDAKASDNDCTMINLPNELIPHVIRGLEEHVEDAEASELAQYIVDWFDIDRHAINLPIYFYDHLNQQEAKKRQENRYA